MKASPLQHGLPWNVPDWEKVNIVQLEASDMWQGNVCVKDMQWTKIVTVAMHEVEMKPWAQEKTVYPGQEMQQHVMCCHSIISKNICKMSQQRFPRFFDQMGGVCCREGTSIIEEPQNKICKEPNFLELQ